MGRQVYNRRHSVFLHAAVKKFSTETQVRPICFESTFRPTQGKCGAYKTNKRTTNGHEFTRIGKARRILNLKEHKQNDYSSTFAPFAFFELNCPFLISGCEPAIVSREQRVRAIGSAISRRKPSRSAPRRNGAMCRARLSHQPHCSPATGGPHQEPFSCFSSPCPCVNPMAHGRVC